MILNWHTQLNLNAWQIFSDQSIFLFVCFPADVEELLDFEILYPIQPEAHSNKIALQVSGNQWNSVQKSATAWRKEFVTLRYRIGRSYMATFLSWLEDNKGSSVSLATPGLQPFIRAAETNNVYIWTWTKPDTVSPMNYEMNVTYLNVLKVAA